MTNIHHTLAAWTLIGRSSSHFTRLCRIVAIEAGIEHTFQPIYDISLLEPNAYGGNPAMKVPVLRYQGQTIVGTEHICRTISEHSSRHIAGFDGATDVMARNAHELLMQAMQAEAQLVFGLQVANLPKKNIYFVKAREVIAQVLTWFEEQYDAIFKRLPTSYLSVLDVGLYVLIEHIRFRQTTELGAYTRLTSFARNFGERPSARQTPYFIDIAPSAYPSDQKELGRDLQP